MLFVVRGDGLYHEDEAPLEAMALGIEHEIVEAEQADSDKHSRSLAEGEERLCDTQCEDEEEEGQDEGQEDCQASYAPTGHDEDLLSDREVLSVGLQLELMLTALRAHAQVACVAAAAGALLLDLDGHDVGGYSCDDPRALLRPVNSSVHVVKS